MGKNYSCEEIATRYNVKRSTVWKWIRTGDLIAFKVGKNYFVSEDELKNYEERKKENGSRTD